MVQVRLSEVGTALEQVRLLSHKPEWLTAALDCARVAEALRRVVSEFASGKLDLLGCKVRRLYLKEDRGSWEGTYDLRVAQPDGSAEQKVAVRGILSPPAIDMARSIPAELAAFGSPGWRFLLPELRLSFEMEPPEEALPAMPLLTDPEQARRLLEESVRGSSPIYRDYQILSCQPQVLSYKPGSRLTILYRLEYPPELRDSPAWPRVVIGKTYRRAEKAQNAYAGMVKLWRSPLASSPGVNIAEPLAVHTGLKVMLQAAVPGDHSLEDDLKQALKSGESQTMEKLQDGLRRAAVALAALHMSGVQHDQTVTWDERAQDIEKMSRRLGEVVPELAQAAAPLLEGLVESARACPAGELVPSHGTFNPEQVLVDGGPTVSLIDFDSFCMAEPALDVGLFCSAIKETGLRTLDANRADRPAARVELYPHLEALAEIFMTQYEALTSLSRPRVALWEALDYLRGCQQFLIKAKADERDDEMFLLEHTVAM